MRWALSSLNYTKTIKTDTMVEAPYIFLCFPKPKAGFWKLCEITQILQMKSGSSRLTIGVLSKKPSIELPFQRSPFTILYGIGIHPLETARGPGGSPCTWLPRMKTYFCWSWNPSSLSFQVPQSQAGGILFLGLWAETGLVKESICTAHSTGKSLIACMDQRRRAERGDICAWKQLHPGRGKKNTKKIKREKYRIK